MNDTQAQIHDSFNNINILPLCFQGVCYDEESGLIFVADTDDDSIKKIDVKSGKTETVKCRESLSSPWDVCLGCSPQNKGGLFDTLFVAMAGKHQVG